MSNESLMNYINSTLSALDDLQQELSDFADDITDSAQLALVRDAETRTAEALASIDELRVSLTSAGFGGGHSVQLTTVFFNGRQIDLAAARMLMDDEICEAIHGTVESEQEFFDAYLAAHQEKFGEVFVFN